MTTAECQRFINSLAAEEIEMLLADWPVWARRKHLPPAGDWRVWLVRSGADAVGGIGGYHAGKRCRLAISPHHSKKGS